MRRAIIFLILISLYSADQSLAKVKRNVISIDLIHRDSLSLPHKNYSTISSKLLSKDGASSTVLSRFNSSMNIDEKSIENMMHLNHGDYLMDIALGDSYSYKALVLASMLSHLIWINCDGCTMLYEPLEAPFILKDSSKLKYTDESCQSVKDITRPGDSEECLYKDVYGNEGFSEGVLGKERIILSSTDDIPRELVLGCSGITYILFESIVQGVVSLGGGVLSLVSQLKDEIAYKFSYCLVPKSANTNSKIRFGYQQEIITTRVPITFEVRPPSPFYYLTLKNIKIGLKTVHVHRDIIIDIGTSKTTLHSTVYQTLENFIVQKLRIKPILDASKIFSLCFETTKLRGKTLPDMTFNFAGGGHVHLEHTKLFFEYGEYHCLAIKPSNGISIFGNHAQVNFLVEYDLKDKWVSFTPKICAEF